jgi:flagellin
MTVSTISSLAAGISRTLGNQNARVANSLQSVAFEPLDAPTTLDVGNSITSSVLKTKITALRASAQNIAQAASQASVASDGASNIIDGLNRLQQLAIQAVSGNLSDADRTALNVEFEAILRQIDTIAGTASFGGQLLLNGSQTAGANSGRLAVADLSSASLFGGADVNIKTVDAAQAAISSIGAAQAFVAVQVANIGTVEQGLQFAAVSLDSAIQNQQAAQSSLSDDDFAQAATRSAAEQVQASIATALLAQTNRLGGNILGLLSE